jgi:chromosome segregation ATPase
MLKTSQSARGASNGWRKSKGGYLGQQIEFLQDQGDMYTKKIEIERRRNEDLDRKIKRARAKLLTAQKEVGGVRSSQEGMISKQRKLRTYENRLDKGLRDLNTTCNYNKKLKETIQNLRRETQQQLQIKSKLEVELSQKKNEMVQTIVSQQAATDARDKAQRSVEALRQQIAEEIEEFEAEYQEKFEEHEDERAAQKALLLAQRKAAMHKKDDKVTSYVSEPEEEEEEEYNLGNMSTQEEKKMRGQNNKAYWSIAKKEVDLKRQTERVQTYEEAFAKIQKETGISSIDEMVTAFITAEEENFSLFNMINELNREMEALEVENGDIKIQIEKLKDSQGGDKSRVGMKKYLERQIEVSNEKAVRYKDKLDSDLNVVDSMKTGILSIFQKIGCNDEALGQQLASTGVTDMNLTQFLGIIEQRINEIVQMNYTFSGGDDDGSGSGQRKPKTPTVQEGSLNKPLPPSMADLVDDYADDDDNVKPAPISDLQVKIPGILNKRKSPRAPTSSKR